jgi:hypothetical protein
MLKTKEKSSGFQTGIVMIAIMMLLSANILVASDFISNNQIDSTPGFQHLQVKTGFNLGWDYPYSAGLELSVLFHELVDCNLGFGLGMSGAKLGIGVRTFPLRNSNFSPMFGAYLYHATGLKNLNVYVNNDEAVYDITPDNAVLLNTGARFRFGKGHYIIAGIGYSIPFNGEKATYKSGSTSESVETFANMFGTGGLSLNFGVLIKISKGRYRIE